MNDSPQKGTSMPSTNAGIMLSNECPNAELPDSLSSKRAPEDLYALRRYARVDNR